MSKYPDPRRDDSSPVDAFYRLFMITGMGHCYGGVGPISIVPTDKADATDPKYDLMFSLEQWVEKGVAPRMVPNDPNKTMSRPICAFPQVTRYKGTGDPNEAASFECAATPAQPLAVVVPGQHERPRAEWVCCQFADSPARFALLRTVCLRIVDMDQGQLHASPISALFCSGPS